MERGEPCAEYQMVPSPLLSTTWDAEYHMSKGDLGLESPRTTGSHR